MSSKISQANGAGRVEAKLHASIAAGEFYEAHQMYRTLYFRHVAQKKFADLKHLLFDGALRFLRLNQSASGLDLAVLFVDVLGKSAAPLDDQVLDQLEALFALIVSTNIQCASRDKFVQEAVKWSVQVEPSFQFGHPRLHSKLATVLWREKNYTHARRHFLLCDDGVACASFLIEYHRSYGFSNEADLFLAQALLQFLCRKNETTAYSLFFHYVKNHPQFRHCSEKAPYVSPLLNFLRLVLLCVESKNLAFYSIVVEKYQLMLSRDPCFRQYLDKIGQIYFGLPPPNRTGSGGESIFGNLLKDLLNNEVESEESGDENFTAPAGTSAAALVGGKKSKRDGNADIPQSSSSVSVNPTQLNKDGNQKRLCEEELD